MLTIIWYFVIQYGYPAECARPEKVSRGSCKKEEQLCWEKGTSLQRKSLADFRQGSILKTETLIFLPVSITFLWSWELEDSTPELRAVPQSLFRLAGMKRVYTWAQRCWQCYIHGLHFLFLMVSWAVTVWTVGISAVYTLFLQTSILFNTLTFGLEYYEY